MYLNTFKLKVNDFYRQHIFGVVSSKGSSSDPE